MEEYSRNNQDQAINRSNRLQGTVKRAVLCCNSIVSKEVHPSEVVLHHIKVVLTSELFLMSYFTRTVTCPLLCTLGQVLCHSVAFRGMKTTVVYGVSLCGLVWGHRCLTGRGL